MLLRGSILCCQESLFMLPRESILCSQESLFYVAKRVYFMLPRESVLCCQESLFYVFQLFFFLQISPLNPYAFFPYMLRAHPILSSFI